MDTSGFQTTYIGPHSFPNRPEFCKFDVPNVKIHKKFANILEDVLVLNLDLYIRKYAIVNLKPP